MNYLVEVFDNGLRIESALFSERDRALYFAERRRKQGYRVVVKLIESK